MAQNIPGKEHFQQPKRASLRGTSANHSQSSSRRRTKSMIWESMLKLIQKKFKAAQLEFNLETGNKVTLLCEFQFHPGAVAGGTIFALAAANKNGT